MQTVKWETWFSMFSDSIKIQNRVQEPFPLVTFSSKSSEQPLKMA